MVTYPIERESQVAVLAVSAVFLVLPTVAIVCRVMARRIAHRALDWSDYLMIAAWFFAACFQIVCFVAVIHFGVGFHAHEIIEMHGPKAIEGFWIALIPIQGLWAFSLSCCKLSVLLLYRKLFPVPYIKVAVGFSVALIILFLLVALIGGVVVCQPFAFMWDKTIEGGYCGDLLAIVKTTGAGNVVTDVLALTVALPSLYSLQLPLYRKAVLLATFSIGLIAVVISIFRLATLITVDFDDIAFTCPEALIFSAVEPALAVILACIPLLRPLLGRGEYSKTGTARFGDSSKFSGKVKGAPGSDNEGIFQPLSDDSSTYQLRPLGPEHNAHVSVNRYDDNWDGDDDKGRRATQRSSKQGSITVREGWEVRQERYDLR